VNGDGVSLGWLAAAFVLVVLALVAWFWSRQARADSGLPAGEIIYSDHAAWVPQSEPLYSSHYQLVGRPDYLVLENDGAIVPVEVKSGIAPAEPHEGHVLQLATYCLLVEEIHQTRPEYGILQYRDKAFAVTYTLELEEDLLHLLTEMRNDMVQEELDRDHEDWGRCEHCAFQEICSQRLA
jgi:CRISPR-associated exonuclease Cas4